MPAASHDCFSVPKLRRGVSEAVNDEGNASEQGVHECVKFAKIESKKNILRLFPLTRAMNEVIGSN